MMDGNDCPARIDPGNAFRLDVKVSRYVAVLEYGEIEMAEQEHQVWLDRNEQYTIAKFDLEMSKRMCWGPRQRLAVWVIELENASKWKIRRDDHFQQLILDRWNEKVAVLAVDVETECVLDSAGPSSGHGLGSASGVTSAHGSGVVPENVEGCDDTTSTPPPYVPQEQAESVDWAELTILQEDNEDGDAKQAADEDKVYEAMGFRAADERAEDAAREAIPIPNIPPEVQGEMVEAATPEVLVCPTAEDQEGEFIAVDECSVSRNNFSSCGQEGEGEHVEVNEQVAEQESVAVGLQEEDGISVQDQAGYPRRAANCHFYMVNGSCSYGSSCHFNHPQRNCEVEFPELNRVGLPIRDGVCNCNYYMRMGTCKYGKRCSFNHPEQSSPISEQSTEHATLNDISSGSKILPSEIFPPNVPPHTEEKEMKDICRIKPHLTITCRDQDPDPFLYKEEQMRSLFANHNHSRDLLQHYENKDTFGLRPMLAGQTFQDYPPGWKHIRLKLLGRPEWITLILRLDTVYTKGFSIVRDGHELCYEITEPTGRGGDGDKEGTHVRLLDTDEYNAVPLPWDVKYREFFGCGKDDDLEPIFRSILEDVDFIPDAIIYLSSFDPNLTDMKTARYKLGGLIFRLCEPPRMNLRGLTTRLQPWIVNWSTVCNHLKAWRKSGFKIWDPEKQLVNTLGVNSESEALQIVYLVLNMSLYHLECQQKGIDKRKGKQEQRERNNETHGDGPGKDGRPAPRKGRRNSSGPRTGGKDPQNDGEEPPMDDCPGVPCGRSRVQLLSMVAHVPILAVNVYDWHRGQSVYRPEDKNATLYNFKAGNDVVPTGPRRPIGADGLVRIDIFEFFPKMPNYQPVPPKRSKQTLCLRTICDQDSYEDDEGCPTTHSAKIEGCFEMTYMLIPNTVECEVGVKMIFPHLLSFPVFVSGKIDAWNKSYGDHRVRLFSDYCHYKEGDLLTLSPSVFCVPYSPELEVHIEVNLKLEGQAIKADMLFTPGIVCLQEKDDYGVGIEITLTMSPDPLPYIHMASPVKSSSQ